MIRKIITTVIVLITIHFYAFSQDFPPVFNALSEEEWAINSYDKDPDAEAIVLFDIGKSQFVESASGYDIKFTRHKRIKILKSSGVQHSEISIPFYYESISKSEKISSLKAYTYNLIEGVVRGKRLDQSTVYEEKINNNWKVKKFTFPDVQEGSIIEFKYELVSPFLFNLPDWEFQTSIPTLYSEYVVQTIPFYEYIFITQSIQKFDSTYTKSVEKKRGSKVANTRFQNVINAYIMKDISAFKDESFITSKNDYLLKMDFQLTKIHSPYTGTKEIMSTWPKLAKEFSEIEEFGKYLKNSETQAKKLLKSELILSVEKPIKDIERIVNYVKVNFNWDGVITKYAKKSAKEFNAQKTGNMAELNLFLCGLLNAAGYEASPVLISTRNHGKISRDHPFAHFFNAAVVLVNHNGRTFLTDATSPLTAFDRIPAFCINDFGLVVGQDNAGWVDLTNKKLSVCNTSFLVTIDTTDLTAKTLLTLASTEMEAYGYKNLLGNNPDYLEKYLLDKGFSQIENVKIRNYERTDRPFLLAAQTISELEIIGNKIIIPQFFNMAMKVNQLKQDERTYPIDFVYSKTEQFVSRINIPEGYSINMLPDELNISDELVDIKLSYSVNEKQITIDGSYNLKKAVYPSENYQQLKKHFDVIVNDFNRHIILEKVK